MENARKIGLKSAQPWPGRAAGGHVRSLPFRSLFAGIGAVAASMNEFCSAHNVSPAGVIRGSILLRKTFSRMDCRLEPATTTVEPRHGRNAVVPAATEGNPGVRNLRFSWLAFIVLPLLAAPAPAQTTGGYTAPAEFMDLFFDFTGSEEAGYPSGQPTLGQMLTQAVAAGEAASHAPGPLVLVVGSDIYVYEFPRRRPARPATVSRRSSQRFLRTDRDQPYRAGARLSCPDQGERR